MQQDVLLLRVRLALTQARLGLLGYDEPVFAARRDEGSSAGSGLVA
jgi:hypothetical protein